VQLKVTSTTYLGAHLANDSAALQHSRLQSLLQSSSLLSMTEGVKKLHLQGLKNKTEDIGV